MHVQANNVVKILVQCATLPQSKGGPFASSETNEAAKEKFAGN